MPLAKKSFIAVSLTSDLRSAAAREGPSQFPEKTPSTNYIYHVLVHHDAGSTTKKLLHCPGTSAVRFRVYHEIS